MNNKYSTTLRIVPFEGFYASIWSTCIDNALEDELEWLKSHYDAPQTLLDTLTFTSEWYQDATQEIADKYTSEYLGLVYNILDIDYKLHKAEIHSPRYYNFTSDFIETKVVLEPNDNIGLQEHLATLMQGKMKELDKYVRQNHTSRSGFISFMSNDVNEWLRLAFSHDTHAHLYLSYLIAYLLEIYGVEKHYWGGHSGIKDIAGYLTFCVDELPIVQLESTNKKAWDNFQEKMREQDRKQRIFDACPAIPGL
jgi:hypothetical protein